MYCPNAKKTTIFYQDINDVESRIILQQGNINITCENTSRTGKYIFTVTDGGYKSGCQPLHPINYFISTFTADSYTISTGMSPYPQFNNCIWTLLKFFIDENLVGEQNFPSPYQLLQGNNPNYSPGGKQLKIFDSTGALIKRVTVKDCNFKVACDDECPPGHIKCEHPSYPGYCCVDCSEVGRRLDDTIRRLR